MVDLVFDAYPNKTLKEDTEKAAKNVKEKLKDLTTADKRKTPFLINQICQRGCSLSSSVWRYTYGRYLQVLG